MAVNTTLANDTIFPVSIVVALTTTWQEVRLPTSIHAGGVEVYLPSAGKVAFSPDTPTPVDGAAVAGGDVVAATTTYFEDLPGPANRAQSIFLALDSGTGNAIVRIAGRAP